jgi:hypothetical protein
MGMFRTCKKYRTVRVRGQGYAKRCADYTVHRRPGSKRRKAKRRRGGYRKGHRPANKGRKCTRFQMVSSPFFRKKVRRCAKGGFGGRRRKNGNGNGYHGGFAPGVPSPFRPQAPGPGWDPFYGQR